MKAGRAKSSQPSVAGLHAIIDTLDNAILYAPGEPFEKTKSKPKLVVRARGKAEAARKNRSQGKPFIVSQ